MISYLRGNVMFISSNSLVLDVSGVGYEVMCLGMDILSLNAGDILELYVHMQVKEDGITLFGFRKMQYKEWFINLIAIQGVGGKVAMSILQNLKIEDIVQAIFTKEPKILQKVSGIGGKLAQRLVNEINLKNISYLKPGMSSNVGNDITDKNYALLQDAEMALVALGFAKPEVVKILADFQIEGEVGLEELVRYGLNNLSKFKTC